MDLHHIKLLYLPPNGSALNPIERLWAIMKSHWRKVMHHIQGGLWPEDIVSLLKFIFSIHLDKLGIKLSRECFKAYMQVLNGSPI